MKKCFFLDHGVLCVCFVIHRFFCFCFFRPLPPIQMLTSRELESKEVKAYQKKGWKSFFAVEGNNSTSGRSESESKEASKEEKEKNEEKEQSAERDMTVIAVFGISDPIRKQVPSAMKRCRKAGIRVIMVTGDLRETAVSIAKQAGILDTDYSFDGKTVDEACTDFVDTSDACTDLVSMKRAPEVWQGAQFRKLSQMQQLKVCEHICVLSRSSPKDKELLVKLLKSMDEVVGVTGDGTNDAPALQEADVGLAMGIAGTEVAKEAANIVIMDDNCTYIVLQW